MSKQRAKGTAFETAIVNYLHERGFAGAVRTGSAAYGDGDILGIPPLVIEAKNQVKLDLSGWLKQVTDSRDRRGFDKEVPVVFHKRRGKSVSQAYATLTVEEIINLYEYLRDL
jgi:hypothetical protein